MQRSFASTCVVTGTSLPVSAAAQPPSADHVIVLCCPWQLSFISPWHCGIVISMAPDGKRKPARNIPHLEGGKYWYFTKSFSGNPRRPHARIWNDSRNCEVSDALRHNNSARRHRATGWPWIDVRAELCGCLPQTSKQIVVLLLFLLYIK
jgi:hypothetical protein